MRGIHKNEERDQVALYECISVRFILEPDRGVDVDNMEETWLALPHGGAGLVRGHLVGVARQQSTLDRNKID